MTTVDVATSRTLVAGSKDRAVDVADSRDNVDKKKNHNDATLTTVVGNALLEKADARTGEDVPDKEDRMANIMNAAVTRMALRSPRFQWGRRRSN